MSFKEKTIDLLYNLFFITFFSLILFFEIYDFYYPAWINKDSILYLLLFSGVFCMLIILFKKIGIFLFPAILLVITLFFYLANPNTTINYINEKNLLLLFLICLGSFFIFLLSERSAYIQLAISIIAIGYLIYMTIINVNPYKLSPAMIFAYVLISIVKFKQYKLKKATPERNANYIFFLLPCFAGFMIILMLLPYPQSPINVDWIRSIYYKASTGIDSLFHSDDIFFNSTDTMDYNNKNATLSNDEGRVIMTIQNSDKSYNGDIYLKGATFNSYSDGNWYNTVPDQKDYAFYDYFQTIYRIFCMDLSPQAPLISPTSITVTYKQFATDTIFLPAKVDYTTIANSEIKNYTTNGLDIRFSGTKSYGTCYTVNYWALNYSANLTSLANDNTSQYSTLNSSTQGNNNSIQTNPLGKTKHFLNSMFINSISPDSLNEYTEFVYNNYVSDFKIDAEVLKWINTNIPNNTNTLKKLSALLNAFSTKKYDDELKDYPTGLKNENDFLHYFLIDNNEGICVHFASAFCLIAQYLDIPARVVQGYCVPVNGDEITNVYSNYGHAWVEVYIDNLGWITFDPTTVASHDAGTSGTVQIVNNASSYRANSSSFGLDYVHYEDRVFAEDSSIAIVQVINIPTPDHQENSLENDKENSDNNANNDDNDNNEDSHEEDSNLILNGPSYNIDELKNQINENTEDPLRIKLIILVSVVVVIIIMLFILINSKTKKKQKNKNVSFSLDGNCDAFTQKYLTEVLRCLTVLQALGLYREIGETLDEFSTRIAPTLKTILNDLYEIKEEKENIEELIPKVTFIEKYQEYKYSNYVPNKDDIFAAIYDKKKLLKFLQQVNKKKYLLTKTKLLLTKIE